MFPVGKKWVTLFHHAYLTIQNSRTFSMLSSLYSHIIYPLNRLQIATDKLHILHYHMLLYSSFYSEKFFYKYFDNYVIPDVRESSKNLKLNL